MKRLGIIIVWGQKRKERTPPFGGKNKRRKEGQRQEWVKKKKTRKGHSSTVFSEGTGLRGGGVNFPVAKSGEAKGPKEKKG